MQRQNSFSGQKLAVWAGLSLLFILTRALLALPWLLIDIPRSNDLTTVVRCAATLLIWVFIVLPEHRFHCWTIMRLNGDDGGKYTYFGAIRLGLYRFLRVIYAAVPAIALALLLYYTMTSNFGALKILKDIGSVGSIFGAQRRYGYDVGLGILLGALLICLVILIIRWFRYTPNDYLGTLKPFRKAAFDRLALRNFLLAAVAYVLWMLILVLFLKAQVSGASGLMSKVTKAGTALTTMMEQREFRLEMVLVLILVYCPLWCVRKYGAAKAAARMRDAA